MSQRQSLLQRVFSFIMMLFTGRLEGQIREFQRRIIRTLSYVVIGLAFLIIGISYITISLAKLLEFFGGILALGLVGLIFVLLGIIILLLSRPRS